MRQIFAFSLLFLSCSVFSQTSDLTSLLDELAPLIDEVQVNRDVFQQELTYDEEAPYRLRLFVTEIDNRGREKSQEFQVNLALIDPNLIRWDDGRNRIQVNLRSGREPVIKAFEDGELDGYESQLSILATDVDNARAIEEKLKAMAPLAKEAWEADTALPEDYEELKGWMVDHVIDVSNGDDSYQQRWENNDDHPSRVYLTQTNAGSSRSSTEEFRWNLADIHPPSISVDIKGNAVLVTMQTQSRAKYIRAEEDGELQNYDDEVVIYCSEVDDAQVMAYALRKIIPLAVTAQEGLLPQAESFGDALDGLQASLQDFSNGDDSYRQLIGGDCQANYTLTEEGSRKTVESLFTFNFADLQARSTEINVRGSTVTVEVSTANRFNFIYLSEDGEQRNYTNSISFYAKDIPNAKLIQSWLTTAIEQCPREIEPADLSALQVMVQEAESTSEGLFQSLESLDDDPCKWAFTVREDNGKRTREERYEFNLYDLNADRVSLVVKGRAVSIELQTNRNEEIIKNYTDGEELGYEKEFSFSVTDIAAGKTAVATLQTLIGSCSED